MFSTDEKGLKQDATQVHTTNSLDDEYSPGVFQVVTSYFLILRIWT